MKLESILFAIVIPIIAVLPIAAQEKATTAPEKITVKLISGETLDGKVAGIKNDAVNLVTDYGVVSIPVSKINAESRRRLNIEEESDATKLKIRINELEELVESLREENAELRKKGRAATSNTSRTNEVNVESLHKVKSNVTYKLSKTGKRHNSRCRYYNSAGEPCEANDGEPCKVCGG